MLPGYTCILVVGTGMVLLPGYTHIMVVGTVMVLLPGYTRILVVGTVMVLLLGCVYTCRLVNWNSWLYLHTGSWHSRGAVTYVCIHAYTCIPVYMHNSSWHSMLGSCLVN
jgi:hypothetical protein